MSKHPNRIAADLGEKPGFVPRQPVVQPPRDVILAAFTHKELDAVRTILRDSESEVAVRHLNAALARAGK